MLATAWTRKPTMVLTPLKCHLYRRLIHFIGTLTTVKDGKLTKETFPTVEPATYVEYYRTFAKAVAGEGEVPVSAEVGSGVIRLVELAKESSTTWRTVDV